MTSYFSRLIHVSVLAVSPTLVIGCSSENPFDGDPDAEATGAALYDSVQCVSCHGPDGSGTGQGPDIRDQASRLSDRKLFRVIEKGKGGMPNFASLSDDETWQIVSYLRTL